MFGVSQGAGKQQRFLLSWLTSWQAPRAYLVDGKNELQALLMSPMPLESLTCPFMPGYVVAQMTNLSRRPPKQKKEHVRDARSGQLEVGLTPLGGRHR